jgi:hypothetical protein
MRRFWIVLALLFILVGCRKLSPTPGLTPVPTQEPKSIEPQIQATSQGGDIMLTNPQEVVENMQALCCEEGWLETLTQAEYQQSLAEDDVEIIDIGATFLENLEAAGKKFDPNQYFTVLTHLSPEEGYLLDYVYFGPGGDGFPWLYARRETDPPFENYSAYDQSGHVGYLSHIQVDGTAEGYYELVVLSILGEQFYLSWHGNYNDWEVVSSQERLEAIPAWLNEVYTPLTKEQEDAVLRLDVRPRVVFEGDKVHVRVLVFTKWGGFFERILTINKDFPHHMTDESTELIPYNCGIMF